MPFIRAQRFPGVCNRGGRYHSTTSGRGNCKGAIVKLISCVVVLASSAIASATVQYNVINLGGFGGPSRAWEVNNHNQVAAQSRDLSGNDRGFLWDSAVIPVADGQGFLSYALSLNDLGDVVGGGRVNGVLGGYMRSGGAWTNLGNLGGGGPVDPLAINNSRQIAGVSRTALGSDHAFFWQNGQMQDLGTFGGATSLAYGINELGDVVGAASNAAGANRAFMWRSGSMTNLGASFSGPSDAYGINDSGVVVGDRMVSVSAGFRAVIWNDGVATTLGTIGGNYSALMDINNTGVAVGTSQIAGDLNRACYFSPETGLVNLNSLVLDSAGLTLLEAWSINEQGSIAGYARDAQGRDSAFLAVLVPAPATVPMVLLCGALAARRRR